MKTNAEEIYWTEKLKMEREHHKAKMSALQAEKEDAEWNGIAYRESLEVSNATKNAEREYWKSINGEVQ